MLGVTQEDKSLILDFTAAKFLHNTNRWYSGNIIRYQRLCSSAYGASVALPMALYKYVYDYDYQQHIVNCLSDEYNF